MYFQNGVAQQGHILRFLTKLKSCWKIDHIVEYLNKTWSRAVSELIQTLHLQIMSGYVLHIFFLLNNSKIKKYIKMSQKIFAFMVISIAK